MAKENVKINQVEAPTLFIGVGGTGCDIVRRVAEQCRPGETENISFVCLDTNVNDLSGVAKSKAKIYYVQTSNTQTVGDYLAYDEDALQNWFPKNAVIYDKTVSEGAGQVRAISRLALNSTIKTGKIKPLYDAIDDLFRKDGKELKQALRIVIVSTSSGGTGSGIALPLAMFVRDFVNGKYPNTSLIVRSLILLPETLDSVIDSSVERDSQRRNAYATIKEINAFMMKGSGFLDVESDLKRYGNLHIDFPIPGTEDMKSLGILPFDFCFLMDGQDAEDSTLVSLEQYKRMAAQALYEQNIGPMQKNAFSVEDNIIKEMSNPGNFGRNRFGAIGASTIRYPYERIADYVAYNWAIDSIGGEGEAAKWCRYDKEYQIKARAARKKGLPQSEWPKLEEVYVEKMSTSKDVFTKDIRYKFLSDDKKRVRKYFDALVNVMHNAVAENSMVRSARDAANELAHEIDYKDTAKRGKASDNLDILRAYEAAVRMNAKKVSETMAEAVFYNETKTIVEKEPYTIEALLKNALDEVCHPNAMRHLLYMLLSDFRKKLKAKQNEIDDDIAKRLEAYSANANDAENFDMKKTKSIEHNLDELCASEKTKPSDELYQKLNTIFPDYYRMITELGEAIAEAEAYKLGAQYVAELTKAFEGFYNTFDEKVKALIRKKEDLVDELAFRKGDSVFNVCSSEALLEELSLSTRTNAEEGALLDSEASARIFDAIKKNVTFEREIQNLDIVEEDKRIDIFDEVLLGYFKQDVRRKCDNLDLNIIDAIALENRLEARIKTREQSENGAKVFDKVTHQDNERHILETIEKGKRLAAPSVQRMRNVESREVCLCAYNKSLLDMRNFRVTELMPKGNAVDSISRYEIRFFNALYNLTPDKLNKFAAPQQTETTKKRGGLYHNAYATYARDIGPDSTKGSKISTHIDKRWDSIAVMPELDFTHQAKEMMKIHQAVIYGLVYNAIQYRKLSALAGGKMVYKYQNSDERYVNLIVSNNTPCDEFYEIFDSMYLSSFIVSDMEIIKAKKSYKDRLRNSNYNGTEFKKALDEFKIGAIHDGPTSLFEIPVVYYSSLPNNSRFNGELSAIVDAVIRTFEEQLTMWEDKDDVKFELCRILNEHYYLLEKNYRKYEKLSCGIDIKDNPVIEIIVRKIQNVIESTPEPTDYMEMIEKMKKSLQ